MAAVFTLFEYSNAEYVEVERLAAEVSSHFDPRIAANVSAAFSTECTKDFSVNLSSIFQTLEYSGFDPRVTLARFFDLGSKITDTDTWEIKNSEGDVILSVGAQDLNMHLNILIMVFVARGAVLAKIVKKSSEQWKTILVKLGSYYNCMNPPKGSQLDKTTITLPRLASCLPQIACYYLMCGLGKEYFKMDLLEKVAGSKIPMTIQTNVFPSLIPSEAKYDNLLKFSFIYNYMLDRLLSSKQKKKYDTIIKDVTLFTTAARNSTFMSDVSRKFFLRMLSVLDANDDIQKPYDDICAAAELVWAIFESKDSHAEAIIEIDKLNKRTVTSVGIMATAININQVISQDKVTTVVACLSEVGEMVDLIQTLDDDIDGYNIASFKTDVNRFNASLSIDTSLRDMLRVMIEWSNLNSLCSYLGFAYFSGTIHHLNVAHMAYIYSKTKPRRVSGILSFINTIIPANFTRLVKLNVKSLEPKGSILTKVKDFINDSHLSKWKY